MVLLRVVLLRHEACYCGDTAVFGDSILATNKLKLAVGANCFVLAVMFVQTKLNCVL
jgi:hypothetical protein